MFLFSLMILSGLTLPIENTLLTRLTVNDTNHHVEAIQFTMIYFFCIRAGQLLVNVLWKLRARMSNGGLKPKSRSTQTHASLSMAPLIHERPQCMEGVCEGVWESECVSECVRGRDLREQIHQMWSVKQASDVPICLGYDLGGSLFFPRAEDIRYTSFLQKKKHLPSPWPLFSPIS